MILIALVILHAVEVEVLVLALNMGVLVILHQMHVNAMTFAHNIIIAAMIMNKYVLVMMEDQQAMKYVMMV